MRHLVFLLGREPHCSVAEIAAVLPDAAWDDAILGHDALVLRVPDTADPDVLMQRLGGTQKIAEVLAMDIAPTTSVLAEHILANTPKDHKTRFGCSVVDCGIGSTRISTLRKKVHARMRDVKIALREHGRSARHVTSNDPMLSSVSVSQNKLLPQQQGIELLVVATTQTTILARTLCIQPFWEWSKRDYGRPGRDAESGMLPPKLARIMINLTRAATDKTILDPFCGSGTILTEALHLGYQRVIGIDSSERAVADAQQNIVWEGERASIQSEVTIVHGDAREIPKTIHERIDAVVTEPYLGPSRGLRNADAAHLTRIVGELHTLYIHALASCAQVCSPDARAVFIVPLFHVGNRIMMPDISEDAKRVGWQRLSPFPELLIHHPLLEHMQHLPYARQDQFVGRSILLFQRIVS